MPLSHPRRPGLREGRQFGRRTVPSQAPHQGAPREIPLAVLYLASPDDMAAGCAIVRGLPVAYRALMTALRAGCRSVALPAEFRATAVGRAIEANPGARRATRWLTPDDPLTRAPLLLV